jgi:hypothetical protein
MNPPPEQILALHPVSPFLLLIWGSRESRAQKYLLLSIKASNELCLSPVVGKTGDELCVMGRQSCATKKHESATRIKVKFDTLFVLQTATTVYVYVSISLRAHLVTKELATILLSMTKKSKDEWHLAFEHIQGLKPPVSPKDLEEREMERAVAKAFIRTPFKGRGRISLEDNESFKEVTLRNQGFIRGGRTIDWHRGVPHENQQGTKRWVGRRPTKCIAGKVIPPTQQNADR